MFCSNCGEKVNDNAKFCPSCGTKLEAPKRASTSSYHPSYLSYDYENEEKQQEEKIRCPYCNSTNVHAHTKGFSGKKAAAGAVAFGVAGALAGTIGSNKVQLTCLNCGKTFKPGDSQKMDELIKAAGQPFWSEDNIIALISIVAVVGFVVLAFYLFFS